MIDLPAPPAIDGERLTAELATVGVTVPPDGLHLRGDRILIDVDADEQQVEQVLAAHDGTPTAAAAADNDARQAVVAAADKARAVLGGTASYTTSEVQRLVARLVLCEARRS